MKRLRLIHGGERLEPRIALTTSLDLATLLPENGGDGSRGFAFVGDVSDRRHRVHAIAPAGDVDGDGYDDVLLGASIELAASTFGGRVYMINGQPNGQVPALLDHQTLAGNGTIFARDSEHSHLAFGYGTDIAGDVDIDGDGVLDVVYAGFQSDSRDAHVVYGSVLGVEGGWNDFEDLLQGASRGPEIPGHNVGFASNFSSSRDSITVADINGDGFEDVITGTAATWNGGFRRGQINVGLGSANGLTTAFTIEGDLTDANKVGDSVANLGDVNGDGMDDLFLSIGYDAGGMIVFGRSEWTDGRIYGASEFMSDTTEIHPIVEDDAVTMFASGAGDVNGDGLDDMIIGARFGDGPTENRGNTGEAYVVFGRSNWDAIDLDDLNGNNGFTIYGVDWNDEAGAAIGGGGDFNGDGFDDLLIGAPKADGPSGETDGPGLKESAGDAYVLYGKSDWSDGFHLQLGFLADDAGLVMHGSHNQGHLGRVVEFVGDINGDGFDDVAVSAPGPEFPSFDDPTVGRTFVVYGSADGTTGAGGGGGTVGADWRNDALPSDVNGDGTLSPLDALLVINELSEREFSNPNTGALPSSDRPDGVSYFDVSDDGVVAPLDALAVINSLGNAPSAALSGSSSISIPGSSPEKLDDDLADANRVWNQVFADELSART